MMARWGRRGRQEDGKRNIRGKGVGD